MPSSWWTALVELVAKLIPSIASAAEKKPVVVETAAPAAPGTAEAENDARLAARRAAEGSKPGITAHGAAPPRSRPD